MKAAAKLRALSFEPAARETRTTAGSGQAECGHSQYENTSIVSMIRSMSHELNNLLSGITMCCDALEDKFEHDSEAREMVQLIRSSAASAGELVERLPGRCPEHASASRNEK